MKLVSVNGIENNIAGNQTINVTPDKNGTVTIAFTAKDINTSAVDQKFKLSKVENNKVVETKTSGVFNFYVPAKAGSFSNKKVMYIDANNSYFVTTDGIKYKVKNSGDIYKNEGIAVSIDSFKSALDIGDTINGFYEPTSASTFDIALNFYFVDLLFDSKFAYKVGTAGYRLDGDQIELSGTGQPNYELLVFKNLGVFLGKTVINSSGTWKFSTPVDQNEITDYSIIQQEVGNAIPATLGSDAKTLRVVEGQFALASLSNGTTLDNNLSNEEITFTLAPINNKSGLVLAQDQVVPLYNATVTVQDLDGTKVKFTNNENQTNFNPVNNGFKVKFGTIEASKVLATGADGVLRGNLDIISIEGVTNAYGMDLRLNSWFQITGY